MANLTVRARSLGVSPRNANLRLFSRIAGGGGSLPIRSNVGSPFDIYSGASSLFINLDLDGSWTGNLPASDSFDVPQEYVLYNGATLLGYFVLPDEGIADIQYTQLRRSTEPVVAPATLSESPPISPAEGEMWFNTTNNVLSIRHGNAWVAATSAGIGGTTVIFRADYDIPETTGVTLTAADQDAFATDAYRNFTGTSGESKTSLVPNIGVNVTEDGIYTAEMWIDVTARASGGGEWGIRLLRTDGVTTEAVDIHQRAVLTEHIETFVSAAVNNQNYRLSVQMPMSRFNQGDYLHAEVFYQHSDSTSRDLLYDVNGGSLVVRRYEGEVGQASRGVTIEQVNARLAAVINPHALRGNFITEGDLDETLRNDIRKSVDVEGISISDRDLTFYSNDGNTQQEVTVPGILVYDEDNPVDVGNLGATQLRFHGSNVSVSRVTAGVAQVTITGGGGTGGGETGTTTINLADWTIPRTQNVTITVPSAATRVFHEFREFTGSAGDTQTEFSAGRGIRITNAGVYSVDLQASIQIRTSSAGEWGISLLRTNGLTGNDEVIHQSSINSFYTPSVSGGEHYIENIQFPLSQFNADDYIYVAVSFEHSENTSQNFIFNLSPSPTTSIMTVRRYEGAFAGAVTSSDVTSIINSNPNVVKAGQFENALRTDVTLPSYTLSQVTPGLAVRLRGNNITIPVLGDGGYLVMEVAGANETRIPLTGILASANLFDAGDTTLSDATGYAVTIEGVKYWFAYDGVESDRSYGLVIAADTAGDYNLTFSLDLPDIKDFARRRVTDVWPASSLGTGTADATKVLFGDNTWKDVPGGVSRQDVSTIVQTDVKDFAETGSTTLPLAADLGSGTAGADTILHGDLSWKPVGNTDEVDAFVDAMRYRRDLVRGVAITQGSSNAAGQIPGRPNAGAREEDLYLEVTVTGNEVHRFLQTALLDLPSVSNSDQLNSGNGITWTGSRIGTVFRIAHSASGELFFAADSIDTYTVTIVADHIDLESFSRRSSTSRVQAAKLGSGTADATKVLYGDGSWKDAPSGGAENAVTLDTSGFTDGDDGSFPAWNNSIQSFVNGQMNDSDDIGWKFSGSSGEWTAELDGKAKEVVNAFIGGGWNDVSGDADVTPFVSNVQFQQRPTAITGITFVLSVADVGVRTTNQFVIVRIPKALEFPLDRYRLIVPEFEGGLFYSWDDADKMAVTDATYDYYIVQVTDKPAATGWHVQVLTPFDIDYSRLPLDTTDIRDMPRETDLILANNGKNLAYNFTTKRYELRNAREPDPISTLPTRFTPQDKLILNQTAHFQTWFTLRAVSSGNNILAQASFNNGWTLTRFSGAATLDASIRSQLVLLRPSADNDKRPIALMIREAGSNNAFTTYNLGNGFAAGVDTRYVVQGFNNASYSNGTNWEVVIVNTSGQANIPAGVQYRPGIYIATTDSTLVAPRYDANVPDYQERTLINGSISGLSIVNTSQDVNGALSYFTPQFLLDAAANRGEIEFSVRMTMSNASDVNMSFQSDRVVQEKTFQVRRFVDQLNDAATITTTAGGLMLDDSQIYLASTAASLGNAQFFSGGNSVHQCAMRKFFDATAGSHSVSIAYHVEARFFPARHFGLAGGAFTDLTDTPSSLAGEGGKTVQVNTAGTALEFVTVEAGGGATSNIGEEIARIADLSLPARRTGSAQYNDWLNRLNLWTVQSAYSSVFRTSQWVLTRVSNTAPISVAGFVFRSFRASGTEIDRIYVPLHTPLFIGADRSTNPYRSPGLIPDADSMWRIRLWSSGNPGFLSSGAIVINNATSIQVYANFAREANSSLVVYEWV